jgi:hypothetical protein
MAINLGSAYGKVGLDASGVKQGVATATASLGNLAKAAQKLNNIGTGLTVGLTLPIVAFGVSAVKSAMEAEKAMAELDAVLKSTGGAAGMTRDELTKMATALQRVTMFSDEEIIKGQSMLLTFTKIGKDVFPMTTEAMLNMAQKFGGVDQAAIQLGKALNDPIKGVTALQRVGVAITKQQKEQIEAFMATGDIAKAQKVILKELEIEFGGLARAMGDTTEGKLKQFMNALDDLKEAFGKQFLPMITELAVGLTDLINKFNDMSPAAQEATVKFWTTIGTVLLLIGPVLKLVTTIITLSSALSGLPAVLATVGSAIGGIGVAFGAALAPIGAVLVATAGIWVPMLILIGLAAALYLAFKNNFGGIRTTAEQLWFVLKWGFQMMWSNLMTWAEEGMTSIGDSMKSGAERIQIDLSGLTSWLETAWKNTMDFMARMAAWGRNAIFSVFRIDWGALGRSIINGITSGFLTGVTSLVEAARKAAQAVLDTIKKTLGIHSPSMEAFKLGQMTGEGYTLGMARGIDPRALARMVARPVQQMSSSQQQIFNQYFGNGLSMQMVRAEIAASREQIMTDLDMALSGGA